MTGRRRRRRKQLLSDFRKTRGYWKVKEETPGRTVWENRFGRGCGTAVRQSGKNYETKSSIYTTREIITMHEGVLICP